MNIVTYLANNNIFTEENFQKNISEYSLDISKQIELIVIVQNKLMNNRDTIIPRINSTIGRELESFRVQTKKVIKELNILESLDNKNDLDFYILEEGKKIADRAKESLESIYRDLYFEIIRRSMRNYEMCLGKVDEGNLKCDKDGVIKVRTVKYISYNLIEHDLFSYIRKLRKRVYNIPIEKMIDEYIYIAGLTQDSKDYIKAMCSYPIESMKVICKYKDYNKKTDMDEWVKNIKSAIEIDGDRLI